MSSNPSVITAERVAALVGVSRATVSRAFTPGAPIAKSTRDRVIKAAERLGYYPNAIASALITGRSAMVGVVVAELDNPVHAALLQVFLNRLHRAGLAPITVALSGESDFDAVLSTLRQYQVGVVVLTSINVTPDMVEACSRNGLTTLVLSRIVDQSSVRSISADQVQGGYLAGCHAVEARYRKIALLSGPPRRWTSWARESGFRRALDEHDIALVARSVGDYGVESGAAAARSLLERGSASRPDLVFCANDLMAIGFMDAARERYGLKVPNDIGVIGFDDIPMAAWPSYALTTIRLPLTAMADAAVTAVRRIQEGETCDAGTMLIPTRLLIRRSTSTSSVHAEAEGRSAHP